LKKVKTELLLREILFFFRSLTRLGNLRHCPVCGWNFSKFLATGVERRIDARCPRCNSHERHRAIWLYLQRNTLFFNKEIKNVLHIAPEFCFVRKLSNIKSIIYTGIDLNYGLAEYREDITNLSYSDCSFDVFIVLHVLEHIQDERRALKELSRVLKPGGWGIVQVPMDLSLEKTKEDPSADTPEKRLAAFGQDDHVRLYAADFKQRLVNEGFKVQCIDMWNELDKKDRVRFRIEKEEPFYYVKI
jgi:SAM-dependent methyltransferase